ncbi:MAG: hypothetical protein IPG53_08025 [Ignavibacteriales bacterium]|nr:hypothetical protein [Ignavibacteriales bacterium]
MINLCLTFSFSIAPERVKPRGRIVSKIYSALAILPGGQLIETDRSGLVSGYGANSTKTTDAINSSMGALVHRRSLHPC